MLSFPDLQVVLRIVSTPVNGRMPVMSSVDTDLTTKDVLHYGNN